MQAMAPKHTPAKMPRAALAGVKEEADDEGDDVAKITKRLQWLNKFAGLGKRIKVGEVVGALYCLGLSPTMDILRSLQLEAASVPDPTWYIKAAVQRANGVRVTPPPSAGPGAGEAEEPLDPDCFEDE